MKLKITEDTINEKISDKEKQCEQPTRTFGDKYTPVHADQSQIMSTQQ